ncbi:10920_t:CDS:2 [Dentiscutata erythropus]|uniref:10920_t:CDS:1 n=1 Tax=Dentiscutata erythropus TaxID=1348616 RepID=A0A9N9NIW5_9GLOM|nr:10920_t:CDS:2 [Dentiscutata erythropus]
MNDSTNKKVKLNSNEDKEKIFDMLPLRKESTECLGKIEKQQQVLSQDSKLAINSSSGNVSWANTSETNADKECNVGTLPSDKGKDKLHVPESTDQPENITVKSLTANEYSVKSCTEALHESFAPAPTLTKKDVFWQLLHRALPLGYRLNHISQNLDSDCSGCPHTTQTS